MKNDDSYPSSSVSKWFVYKLFSFKLFWYSVNLNSFTVSSTDSAFESILTICGNSLSPPRTLFYIGFGDDF